MKSAGCEASPDVPESCSFVSAGAIEKRSQKMPEEKVYICDVYPDCNRAASGKKSAAFTLYMEVMGEDGKPDKSAGIDFNGKTCSKEHAGRKIGSILRGEGSEAEAETEAVAAAEAEAEAVAAE